MSKISPYAALAFDSLCHSLINSRKIPLEVYKKYCGIASSAKDEVESPLFVSWNISMNDERHLRGCIGTFSDLPIESGIREYALISAFDDDRFNAINKVELSFLECSITLLRNFEQCDDPFSWELGKHGIKINFQYQGQRYSGTFLPEVAVEQNWDKTETLQNLIKKAGLYKSIPLKDLKLKVIRYQGEKSKITYDEFIDLRKKISQAESIVYDLQT